MTLAAALSGHLAPITAGLYVICQARRASHRRHDATAQLRNSHPACPFPPPVAHARLRAGARSAACAAQPCGENTPAAPPPQICGALAGAMLQVAITPGLAFGKISAPACHGLAAEVGGMPLFVWEAFAVFVLCYVSFPVSFTRPSYGGAGPVVLFLALLGALSTGVAVPSHHLH